MLGTLSKCCPTYALNGNAFKKRFWPQSDLLRVAASAAAGRLNGRRI